MVKNTLTEIAADRAGAEPLKEVLEGPTAFTFVRADGDVALAAKALAQFKREHDVLDFKGGVMSGEPLTVEQLDDAVAPAGARGAPRPARGVVASPITGLVRGLNALIAGLAIQLGQIVEQGLLPAGEAPAEEPAAEEPAARGDRPPRRRPLKRRPPRNNLKRPTAQPAEDGAQRN